LSAFDTAAWAVVIQWGAPVWFRSCSSGYMIFGDFAFACANQFSWDDGADFVILGDMDINQSWRQLWIMVFMVGVGFGAFCQSGARMVKKGMCPVEDGVIEKYEFHVGDREPPRLGATIFGKDSCVRTVQKGTVAAVFERSKVNE
jgi:hypothetical protein